MWLGRRMLKPGGMTQVSETSEIGPWTYPYLTRPYFLKVFRKWVLSDIDDYVTVRKLHKKTMTPLHKLLS